MPAAARDARSKRVSKDSGGGTAGSSAAVQNEALPAPTRNPRSARAAASRADESFEDAGASGVASLPTRPGSASKAVEKPSAGALSSLLADSSSPVPALQEAAGIMAPSSSRLLHSVLAEGGEDAVGPGDEVLANVVQVLDGHGVFDEGAAAEGAAGVGEEGEKHVPVQVGVDYDQYILATRFCGRVHPLVELRCKKRGKTLKSHLWLRPDRGVSITRVDVSLVAALTDITCSEIVSFYVDGTMANPLQVHHTEADGTPLYVITRIVDRLPKLAEVPKAQLYGPQALRVVVHIVGVMPVPPIVTFTSPPFFARTTIVPGSAIVPLQKESEFGTSPLFSQFANVRDTWSHVSNMLDTMHGLADTYLCREDVRAVIENQARAMVGEAPDMLNMLAAGAAVTTMLGADVKYGWAGGGASAEDALGVDGAEDAEAEAFHTTHIADEATQKGAAISAYPSAARILVRMSHQATGGESAADATEAPALSRGKSRRREAAATADSTRVAGAGDVPDALRGPPAKKGRRGSAVPAEVAVEQ